MKYYLNLLASALSMLILNAQEPAGYYDSANGKTGYELKTALKDIITNGHTDQGYDNLYNLYENSDTDQYYENDNTVLDMYSEKPTETDSYEFTHNNNTCGNYSSEGDCYNREHLLPQSAFNSASPMKSDGHFVVPSDGYVNNRRSNYPFGIVTNPTWTSTNGSKLGDNSTSGYSGTVFEPIDEFKGDIARMLFYVATRYEDQISNWSHDMLNGTSNQVFADWFLDILLQWHQNDPVSQREIDRNNAVYNYQGNRNPYIDHPEWVNDIWGNSSNNNNNGAPASSVCVDEDFVDFSDWTNNGTSNDTSSAHYGDASPCRAFQNGNYMISPSVDNPNTLEFHQDASNNGNGKTATVEYSINGGSWTQFYSFTVDKNGSTETIDLTDLNGVNLSNETGVKFKFNSSFNTWYLDDVKVYCGATNSNDNDSQVAAPDTQIQGGTIDSTKDTPSEAVDVFKIKISDLGTGDGTATQVTNIRLYPGTNNTADWTNTIQGFVISTGGTNITPASTNITDNYIDFAFNSGDLSIADGTDQELSFAVYLNSSNIEDQSILSFMIDADNHGFTADTGGSLFADTFSGGDITSADFTIDVSITELRFIQQPTDVEVGQVISPAVTVAATDENGNIDTEFDGNGSAIGLTTTGSFDAGATTQVDAVNGIATFDNLIFDTEATNITLTTTDPDNWGWTNITSNTFNVVAASSSCASELIISEYIEGSSNNKFLELYNGTGATIDLSNYEIRQYNNGSSSVTYSLSLSGSLNDGAVYVIENSNENLGVSADLSTSNSVMNFNGDDAIELFNTSTGQSVDIIGKIGQDPGSAWGSGTTSTKNHTLVRKTNITQGDTNGNDAFNPADEWEGYAQDEVSYLGSHTMNCTACSAPTTDAVFDSNSPQSVTGISANLSWTNGGGNKRIVVMRDGADVGFVPVDDTTYTANSTFGNGTDVSGNGEYIIYNDTGNSVSVSGLSAGHTYYVKIYEYNCSAGSEKYYTNGTPATDVFVTIPNNPSDFAVGCITNTSIELSWTAPVSSEFDGYLLVVREGSATPHSVNSTQPSTISNADTYYPNAGEFGGTTPKSRYLYIGNNTQATITGLTEGTDYTFKIYTYSETNNDYQYSSGTQTTQTISLNEIQTAHATPDNAQAIVYWIPPTGCYDEIMVVANETAGIDFTPSGNGSAYTANSDYNAPNQVVYKGNENDVTVTSLTNETTYYFEIFVRKGTEWSNGIEVNVTPRAGTKFQSGQLIFTGYDGQVNGSGADDEYLIATLIDIVPGTTFSLVNSRYEAGAPANVRTDKWGGAGNDAKEKPGVAEITYLGTTNIPAGSVIRFKTDFSASFLTYAGVITGTTETDQTADFSSVSVYGNNAVPNISTSGSDQIFLAQGAFVFDGIENDNEANYILKGSLLHGITNRTPWVPITDACNGDSSGGNSRESRLHPSLNCFNVENSDSSAISGFYQNDELHNGSFRDIILSISNAANWTLGTDRYNLDPSTTNETDAGHTFSISGGHNPGTWVSTSDTNWFNCSNWETLAVPDANTPVYIDSNSSVDAVIDANALYAELFNGIAECKDLSVSNLHLKLEGNQTLKIHGNLFIENGGIIDADDDDDSTADATIHVYGNWNNADKANFLQGNSKVIFEGNSPQTITTANGNQTEEFYDLTIDNTAGVHFASGNIHATHNLEILNDTDITIADGHYILAGNNLINNTNIIIENQACLVQTDDNGNISGSGTFRLNKTSLPLDHYYDYVYWSSPIAAGNITLGDIRPDSWRYYKFDPTIVNNPGQLYPGWVMLSASDLVDAGVGYAVSAPANHVTGNPITASFIKGNDPFNNGIITVNIYKKGGADNIGDYNLIGNPYPSAIDFHQFATDNTDINGSYSLWTKCAGLDSNGHHQQSGYTTYTVSGGNGTATAACSGNGATAGRYIATTQGFMVTAVNDNANVRFNNSQRVINNNTSFLNRPANLNRDILWLDMSDNNEKFAQIAVGFYQGATDNFDRMYDAYNSNAGNGFALSSLLNQQKLSIQGLARTGIIDKVVPLSVENDAARQISFHINHTEGLDNVNIYLKDNELQTIHDLKASNYIVNLTQGNFDNRFELIFNTIQNIDNTAVSNLVTLGQNNGIFNLKANETNINKVYVYDLTGKLLFEQNQINKPQMQIDLHQIARGNLLVFKVILDHNKVWIKKQIKK